MYGRLIPVVLCAVLLFALVSADAGSAFPENSYEVLVSDAGARTHRHVLLDLYQQKLSLHDGARCRFYPTCSAFYREALDEHGYVWALLMVLDRMLYREHAWALKAYPVREDVGLYVDPVHMNYIFNRDGYFK
jgi:putative component of membrane protein insertase Oxa1/YidC/SpoIIIJ protein YidD